VAAIRISSALRTRFHQCRLFVEASISVIVVFRGIRTQSLKHAVVDLKLVEHGPRLIFQLHDLCMG
jgi:hypothetical protein